MRRQTKWLLDSEECEDSITAWIFLNNRQVFEGGVTWVTITSHRYINLMFRNSIHNYEYTMQ